MGRDRARVPGLRLVASIAPIVFLTATLFALPVWAADTPATDPEAPRTQEQPPGEEQQERSEAEAIETKQEALGDELLEWDYKAEAEAEEAEAAEAPEPEETASADEADPPTPDPDVVVQALDDELLEWDSKEEHQEARERDQRPRLIHTERWTYEWQNGSRLERDDGAIRLLFGGRLLLDAAVINQDPMLENETPGCCAAGEVRQARLNIQGLLFHRFLFKVMGELTGGTSLIDLYVGLRELGPLGTVQMGVFKQPFSLEQAASLKHMVFLERSLMNALSPRRATGFMATNTHLDDRLRWALGVFGAIDFFQEDDNLSSGFGNSIDMTMRVTGLPLYEDHGRRLIELGISYNLRTSIDDEVQFSQRPESQLADVLLQTPELPDVSQIHYVGLELAVVRDSLSVQGEFIDAYLRRDGPQQNLNFFGGYLEASWFLTGEYRVFGKKAGVFGRVVPKRRFKFGGGQWGAFELGLRVSYLDLTDEKIRGGTELNTSVALNWYPRSSLRASLNYIHGHVNGQGNVNIFQVRAQLEY